MSRKINAIGLSLNPPSHARIPDSPLEIEPQCFVSRSLPLSLSPGWQSSLGTLGMNEIEDCDLWLWTDSPTAGDKDRSTRWYQALALHQRFSLEFAIRLAGTVEAVNTFTRLKTYRSAFGHSEITGYLDQVKLTEALKTADLLGAHQRANNWQGRLGRGMWSLLFGLRREYGEFRHLDLVRALDAILGAGKRGVFADRGKRLFICPQHSTNDLQQLFYDIYTLRSQLAHVQPVTSAMQVVAKGSHLGLSERELVQAAQTLACSLYIGIIRTADAPQLYAQDDLNSHWDQIRQGAKPPVRITPIHPLPLKSN